MNINEDTRVGEGENVKNESTHVNQDPNARKFRDGSEKITAGQAVADSWRGVKMLNRMSPGKIYIDCAGATLWSIWPLLVLFLSSLVIGELGGERDIGRIVLYVSLAVGSGFLASLGGHVLRLLEAKVIGDNSGSEYWERHGMLWDEKHISMDFKDVEDARVATLKADANAKMNAGAFGLMRLGWFFPGLVGQVLTFAGAAGILSGMFLQPQGDTFVGSHAAMVVLLAASILVPATVGIALIKRRNRHVQTKMNELAKYNVLQNYYRYNYISTPDGGLDVRIFKLAQPILAAFAKSQSWFNKSRRRIDCQDRGISAAVGVVFSVLAFLVIGLRALEGMYDIGEVTRFVGGVTAFSGSVVGMVYGFADLRENAPYLGMAFDYFDLPITPSHGKLQKPTEPPQIIFHDVSFKYPGADDFALKNINITFYPGERLAVVGMNGSGKTTMMKLLSRLYEPTSGHITMNGRDIREYEREEYIASIAVVAQDFCLMGLPLGQNIAAATKYNAAEAEAALEKTGFSERFATLDNGLETFLYKHYDESGVNFSGGELQKVALARAIYKNAPVVALDEPTAALDPIAEYEIYSKFNDIIGEKTAVFISHRLSSCKFCHRIAVFHEGEIIQHGTHDDLLEDSAGKYHEMWHAQAQYYNEN